MDISGSKILVTGATGGLGQAIAAALGDRGAKLVLTGRRTEVLMPLAAPYGAEVIGVDLADPRAVARLAEECGSVDAVVANAGLPGSGRLESYAVEEIDRLLDVNLRAPIMLAHALAPAMVARGRGAFVFMSSLSGKSAAPGTALYSATKYGLRGFALSLRADLHGSGVGVSVVNPGFIRDAGMFAESGAELPAGVGTKTPADVAAAVVRALEKNPAELDVAPLPLRAGAALSGLAPGFAEAITRRLGGHEIADRISAGQADKR